MQLMKPRTYHELMQYKRCMELRRHLPGMDDALFERIYLHMLESPLNKIGVYDGKMLFYQDNQVIERIAVTLASQIISMELTARALDIRRPVSYSGGDGGSSGNNNNNNNNNNG